MLNARKKPAKEGPAKKPAGCCRQRKSAQPLNACSGTSGLGCGLPLRQSKEIGMDPEETAAMTEASGLMDPDRARTASTTSSGPDGSAHALSMPSQEDLERWAEKLREMTVKAPLRSLFVAFLAGIWVARRR
jgi:hypothetical protein